MMKCLEKNINILVFLVGLSLILIIVLITLNKKENFVISPCKNNSPWDICTNYCDSILDSEKHQLCLIECNNDYLYKPQN